MTALARQPVPSATTIRGTDHWIVRSALCTVLAVVAIGSLATVLAGMSTSEPLPDLIAAINERDQAAVERLLAGEAWTDRVGWLMATNATLSLNGCTTGGDGFVTCQVHNGDDWFFNEAAPRSVARSGALATSITVEILDEQVHITDWPLPTGLADVEGPFRGWVLRTHPQMSELMWRSPTVGNDVARYMIIDAAGGEAHQRLAAAYLRVVNPPAG
jgi:hypothetical protein